MYRRDWVVKYAEPTEYVWDWDSAYVQENGHPAVTPLEAAVASGNLEGWKANEVTEFTANPGDDPDNTYTDNVIFPSGTGDPLTISDWEWMFEAFDAALEERGYGDDSDAYCITIPYQAISSMAIWCPPSAAETDTIISTMMERLPLTPPPTISRPIWSA